MRSGRTFNLTPTRLRALRIIRAQPGISCADLAVALVPHGRWGNIPNTTRFGCGQAAPLYDHHLINWNAGPTGERTAFGPCLYLTDYGRVVANRGELTQ